MKKIIATLIAVLLLASNFTVYANDYDTHWSASSINYLVDKGIVSGNYYGDVNPEGVITRAEFAKIVNRAFGYTDASGEQFQDVSADKWYYNEMKIARNAGYMQGDANGNSNPEKGITRAEVCVIYGRILKLNVSDTYTGFADDSSIPEWAKGSIAAMKKINLLKGYSDNTFKADNSIKRCEAFTVVANQMKQVLPDENGNVVLDTSGTTINSGFSTGGGGGGGGGGGSFAPPSNNGLSAPSNLRWDKDDYTIRWASVSGAASYEVTVELITEGTQLTFNDHIETVTDTSYSIKSLIENLMLADSVEKRFKQELFKVSVVAKNSSYTSAPAVINDISYNNEFIDFPELEFKQTYANDVETMKFEWSNNENAEYYKLEIDFVGDGSYEPIGDPNGITNGVAELTTSQIDKIMGSYNMRVTAPSKYPNKVLSLNSQITTVNLPLYGGESEGFNLVYNERHFNNIKHNPSEKFKLMQDIILQTPESFDSFGGRLDGNGKSITFDNLTSPLITNLTGSVENLHLYGSANLSGQNTAILVGVNNGGAVRNCVNNASFTINSSSPYSGGIVGRNLSGTITGCINYGDMISYSSSTAPIVGECNDTITQCANYGDITLNDSTSTHGGIVGLYQTTSTITECVNYGDITTTGNATKVGGIAGEFRGSSTVAFKNCFNSGDINVGSGSGIAGGIFSYIPVDSYDNLIIENCYNAGKILIGSEDTTNANSVYHSQVAGVEGTTINNCYYITSGTTQEKQGSVGLSEAESKVASKFVNFDFEGVWKMDNTSGYEYPQLISTPYRTAPEKLSAPSFTDNKQPYNNGTDVEIYITVDNGTENIVVSVTNGNNTITENVVCNGLTDFTVRIPVSNFIVGETYTVKLTAEGDGVSYLNSESFTFSYTHNQFMLRAPVINVNWFADDTQTADVNDEIYQLSWSAIEEEGGLTVNKYNVEINGTDAGTTTELYYNIVPSDYNVDSLTVKVTAMNDDVVVSNTAEKNVDILFAGEEIVQGVTYILIGNERQLNNISDCALNYKLSNNFTVSDFPILEDFSGIFEGNGKTINIINGTKSLFSSITSTAVIKNLTIDGEINLAGKGAAFVTNNFGGTITNCVNHADIVASSSFSGGIVGENYAGGSVTYCGNSGNITFNNSAGYFGGIIGYNGSENTVEYCYNTGNLTNGNYLGGIIGYSAGVATFEIKNCFNNGIITTTKSIYGGIIGGYAYFSGRTLKITNCYNSADITANLAITYGANGGATVTDGVILTNCYYLKSGDTVGIAGSIGLTSDEMKLQSSFQGFDFDNVWVMLTEGEYLYPVLR